VQGSLVISAIALLVGAGIGYVDSRPHWDDTGITVGVLILVGGLLGYLRPRSFWITGLLLGLPVLTFNYFLHGNLQSLAALVVSLIAAMVGGLIGRSVAGTTT
jgi:uncharacterized membrane protein (UPF0136 family)